LILMIKERRGDHDGGLVSSYDVSHDLIYIYLHHGCSFATQLITPYPCMGPIAKLPGE
jgi:hypothetical protein